ncbi:SF1B family DNA helicase RecD2 [Desulfatitalea alkaliphila]|uniref:AAA family ATPase n=1 Tax=Desulfatitalea alkaliphila TaxID=2929485 RepID=A0AA41UHT2_9BACT|nr:AAA family ATPase [Desulfatitalea alkaliphila]MCJ8499965.1 AAA family ATPase [Desulfatitalea alkaliphila]
MEQRSEQALTALGESLRGIVQRVTYHNPTTGWSVLRVQPFDTPHQQETVVVHQTKVFAGATMLFRGAWTVHPRHGRQFRAVEALEQKPADSAALEKYLGSGLIKGVGPKTARKIVRHFGADTLTVFEEAIERLTEVPGIAEKKLAAIRTAWQAHRAVRDVMMFLQSHGISTLFAVRIYQVYGDEAIARVSEDPYRLAADFYGIGFFSADRVALSLGWTVDSPRRIMAAIRHVLADSRQMGHCYLTQTQVARQVETLLDFSPQDRLADILGAMATEGQLMVRMLPDAAGQAVPCYYSKTLYYDELAVARKVAAMTAPVAVDRPRVAAWIDRYCRKQHIVLSDEQNAAVQGIVGCAFSVLTGGPGCGKTTTTRVLAGLLTAMGRKVLLAAPTGRAAQRMMDVIGKEAKTIHRLLEWRHNGFRKNETAPLEMDWLIVDECSMLDISLTAALLRAVPQGAQVLFIGDADQLPAVGAGNVLKDLISAGTVPGFRLTRIFRQAEQSLIIRYAHQINAGRLPRIDSPFHKPEIWRTGAECLFIDAEEATRDQLQFINKVKRFFDANGATTGEQTGEDPYTFRAVAQLPERTPELVIPQRFRHVDLEILQQADSRVDELLAVLNQVHPWSALHYGLPAVEVVRKLYMEWIPKYHGGCEVQILSPMIRGSLGTLNLNAMIQAAANPPGGGKRQLQVGQRLFREGDRVIHRRNNYELGVFNGDIGVIRQIDNETLSCEVAFTEDQPPVRYQRNDILELDLAYAITIHKSQGSEFDAVILPVLTQHYKMLFRNLLYTGLTRARRLAVLVGTRKALAMAVHNQDTTLRQTALGRLLADFRP